MADEASIRVGLYIRKTDPNDGTVTLVNGPAFSKAFQDDVSGTFGPTPGTVAIPATGVSVPLTGITNPGWCWIENQGASSNVQVGVKDADSALFYPLLELKPGQALPLPLTTDLFEEYQGTGTGTGSPTNLLWLRAIDPTTRSATTGTCFCGCYEA